MSGLMEQPSPLERAVSAAGSQAALAAKIGTTQQNISRMLRSAEHKVAAEYVLPIERATGVSRHDLRPDLYPAEPTPSQTERSVA
jgi:DNA-binding transcriptional regulator YdaS (Cro superfamily)